MKEYLRFKAIPKDEKSWNFIEEKYENGVSAFELADGKPVFSNLQLISSFTSRRDDDAYIVTGDKVGVGFDGEPLLKNVKIIKKANLDVDKISMGFLTSKFKDKKDIGCRKDIYMIREFAQVDAINPKTGEIVKEANTWDYPDWKFSGEYHVWEYAGFEFSDPVDGFDTIVGTERLIAKKKELAKK
ncbi:hypothetical protein [Liquorilactobacillus nagelii]|uniref:hypothetical protein n=1 Tax=Liquorilactobacillus nagelii TaxID=82688 RepID=UPI001CCCF581|nr:hypothetical protein [Liquorilactobacillus nagelii]ULQ49069.1 hypothetical protein J6864_08875 [Liquorilactobacillus nagelii]